MKNHEGINADVVQKEEVHDIYDDSYWEHRNPEHISVDELAKIVGKTEEECVDACREAISTGKRTTRDEGSYALLGQEDEETGDFYGSVWMFPKNSRARFDIEGTSTHVDENGVRIYIADDIFKEK